MADALMMVNSISLTAAASQLRSTIGDEPALLRNGVKANAAQLEAAAAILRGSPKSQITAAVGVPAGSISYDEHEAAGFIDGDGQGEDDVLVLVVGILPCSTYRIGRDGLVEVGTDG